MGVNNIKVDAAVIGVSWVMLCVVVFLIVVTRRVWLPIAARVVGLTAV